MAKQSCLRVLPVVLVLLGTSCATFEDSNFEMKASLAYLHNEVSGDLGLVRSSGGQSPGQVNHKLDDNLDLGEADTPYLRVDMAKAPFRASISGFHSQESGRSQLTTNFGDIPAGTNVTTDVTMFNVKAAAMIDVIHTGLLRVSPGIALNYFDINFDMRNDSGTFFEEVGFKAPVPMPMVEAALDFGRVALTANFGGMYADLSDADGLYWDGEARLSFSPAPAVEILLGYRLTRLDARGVAGFQDFSSETLLQGFFLGGSIGF